MKKAQELPDSNRLSIVFSSILLAYVLTKFINDPSRVILLNIIGILIPIQINYRTLATIAITVMAASGTDWILRDTSRKYKIHALPHLILPTLTSWILSILLINLSLSPLWWLVFSFGGILFYLVILAEFIVSAPNDPRKDFAGAGLNALSMVVFFILAISLRSTKTRLIMLLPAEALAACLVSVRIFHLQLGRKSKFSHAVITALIVIQISAPLHYFPLNPIGFGLLLLGPLYGLVNFIINIDQRQSYKEPAKESLIALAFFWVAGLWLS